MTESEEPATTVVLVQRIIAASLPAHFYYYCEARIAETIRRLYRPVAVSTQFDIEPGGGIDKHIIL